jgi:hypothetical protein
VMAGFAGSGVWLWSFSLLIEDYAELIGGSISMGLGGYVIV